MNAEPQDPTLSDVLRPYRAAFRGIARGVAWFWAAGPKKKLIVSIAIILSALAVVAAIGMQRPAWRARIAQHFKKAGVDIGPAGESTRAWASRPVVRDPSLARSIAAGVSNRVVYVDGYHGRAPVSMLTLKDAGVNPFVMSGSYVAERKNLFRAGVVVMLYGTEKPELSAEEYDIIRSYVANGGRLVLLCPVWVWAGHEKRPMDRLPYNQIAAEFGVALKVNYSDAPLKIFHSGFAVEGIEALSWPGAFSSISYRKNAHPILIGSNGNVAAVAAVEGNARMILWAQDNLMGHQIMATPQVSALIKRAFDWLLNDDADLAGVKGFAPGGAPGSAQPAAASILSDQEIARSIAAGVSNRIVYVDGYHAVIPPDLSVFTAAGAKATPQGYQGFVRNRDALFKSGLLVMQYALDRREPEAEEYAVVRQYIANGGRLLLMCPAWVWEGYDKKPLSDLPYDIIAREFGLAMDTAHVTAPLRNVYPGWDFDNFQNTIEGTFSAISFNPGNAKPILVGSDGKVAAVAATKGNARVVLWGQDNLLAAKTTANPKARKGIVQMVNWLLE